MRSKIITLAALFCFAGYSQAQQTITVTNSSGGVDTYVLASTNPPAVSFTVSSGLSAIWQDVKGATNFAIAPYATYAPKAPTKIGGGALFVYNANNYVGAGIGVDWLGGFSMVSGNIELKLPLHPLASFGFTNLLVTPFVLGGIGTPIQSGGGGSGLSTIEDVGADVKFGHLWGGEFIVGASYGKWLGNSPYDVTRYHFFLGWQKGF